VATGDPYFSEKYVAGIKAVTAEDIRRVAAKYLVRDAMTLAVVRPPGSASEAASSENTPPVIGTVHRQVLPNGMVLLLKQMNQLPIVSMDFMVRGGLRFEPEGKSGLSRFMANLLTKGTETRNKQAIARTIEDVGGAIGSSSGYNTVGVSVSVLKDDLDVGLELLSDVIVHPSFPEAEIEKQREETLLAIRRQDEEWTTEVTRLFKRHYYRKHPYRNDPLGTEEAVSSLTRDDIIEFYRSIVMPNNAVLAVYGDIRPDAVAQQIGKAFEGFSPRVLEQPIIETETANIQEDEQFVVYNEKTSAGILVGYNGLTLTDPDRAVVDVIDAVVSGIGYPGGWLHEALRGGDESLVYYVHAYPAFGVDGGFFAVMTQTTPTNYDKVIGIIDEQMETLQTQAVDAETLTRAKEICVIMHEMGLETISAQASSAVVNEVLDLGYDYDERYPALIEAVTGEDVLRVSKELFSHRLLVATKPEATREKGPRDSGE
jgi:zinc protease